MSGSFTLQATDAGLPEDSGLKSVMSSFEERIPSQSGTPSVEFVKSGTAPEKDRSVTPTAGADENSCPNAEVIAQGAAEVRKSASPADEHGDLTEVEHQGPAITDGRSIGDVPSADCLHDVSMMSVDGHMSVDLGPEPPTLELAPESGGSDNPLKKEDLSSRCSNPSEDPASTSRSNCENENFNLTASLPSRGSSVLTPVNKSALSARISSICDDEDDLFLTPTQGTAGDSAHKQARSSYEASPVNEKADLNGTFDKPEPEVSLVESKANETFDKEPSIVEDAIPRIRVSSSGSPDLDLRLDSTCQPEESKAAASCLLNEQMSTPVRRQARGTFTYDGIGEKDCEDFPEQTRLSGEQPAQEEDTSLLKEKRKSSSFAKRTSSILELSFVSSPKRGNFQMKTPSAADRSTRSSLINFNESIAFDFSAAAKSAEVNGGVAEMGSFVFASSSGLPVAKSDDPFDLSTLEKTNKLSVTKDEKFTRVSFIAMFDPIKVHDGQQEPSVDKMEPPATVPGRKSSIFSSHRASVSSPLIKGLPTPVFVKPKAAKSVLKAVGVQTDEICEQPTPTPAPSIDDDVAFELVRLNQTLESQAKALSTYEQVVTKLFDARRKTLENPAEDPKSKIRLDEELERNKRLEDAVRSMENSMHSTLMRMQEFRIANEDLRKVVEEQRTALVDTRSELDACQKQWQEEINDRDESLQKLGVHLDETNRAHEKSVSMLKLQLQAKESEIESLNMQNSIARKEVDSLRGLVNSMKLQ
ncbi:uncharacterized protein LOC100906279 [Galendromus occidentalis]|uniref:Uncharacterized protein LOC100906279 n=1 Tax=Galendromus occidentalis TaxID=34638 RepID=A0AAJ6W0H0_9ACAR|nr:uncharacterized protein LOC100906279 [Galendromus occidentalis]